MTDKTNEMYRRILEKIVKEDRAEHFFDKILDGYSVTIDAKSGKLVYAKWAGYDHAAAELRWIPVSERLPENGKAHYLTIEEDGKRSVIKGFWHQRSGRWCGITETTEVGYKLPVTQTVIAWQIIPEKIIIEPYAEPADNIGEGV